MKKDKNTHKKSILWIIKTYLTKYEEKHTSLSKLENIAIYLTIK